MQNNIFAELKSQYDFLTKTEKRIADILLNSPQYFINYSITRLSEFSGASQGSINNFAKKFCGGGFAALKLRVAACLSSFNEKPFATADNAQGIKGALELKVNDCITAFKNTLAVNEEQTLKAAVDMILSAKRIEMYGTFSSGIVANDFCHQLIQLGIPTAYVADSLMASVSASMLDKDCLVIAVSSSGRTKEIIDSVRIAKDNGVNVICMTADKNSPLAKMSETVLVAAASDISISERMSEIRMSQLFIIDALCSYIRSIIYENGKDKYYKLLDIINSHSIND